jgi:hypothetical protein
MRHYKIINRNYDEKYLDKTTCDLCRKETEHRYGNSRETDAEWSGERFEHSVVKIKHTNATHYPGDEYYGSESFIDLCDKCFNEKLIPLLEEKWGIQAQTRTIGSGYD